MAKYLGAVGTERARQQAQGKSEDLDDLTWYLVVADQLALITRTLSLTRYRGVATTDSGPELSASDRKAIQLGLERLGACAMAWHEALEDGVYGRG